MFFFNVIHIYVYRYCYTSVNNPSRQNSKKRKFLFLLIWFLRILVCLCENKQLITTEIIYLFMYFDFEYIVKQLQ